MGQEQDSAAHLGDILWTEYRTLLQARSATMMCLLTWPDEILKLRRRLPGHPLRIGIELDSLDGPAWISEVIARIRSTPEIVLAAAFTASPKPFSEGLASRLYRRWCAARVQQNLCAIVDLRSALGGVPVQPRTPEATRACALDVLIRLSDEPGEGRCAGLARLGVWSFLLSDPSRRARRPPYFWEMLRGDSSSAILLCAHDESFDRGAILYRYAAATRCSFFAPVNAFEPLSAAPSILVRRLLDLREHGAVRLTELPEFRQIAMEPPGAAPGWFTLMRFFASILTRRVRMLEENRGPRPWIVAFRRNPASFTARTKEFCADGFVEIPNSPGTFSADPFPVQFAGRTFVFFEQIASDTGFGHLSAIELTGEEPSAPFPVLKAAHHLSYPCVIEDRGTFFLLPESSADQTVTLYAASEFPVSWTLHKILVEGVHLVDTTPFRHEGTWYFFTTTVEMTRGGRLETFLFFADALDGEWNYHPQNPICSDVRRARGAGNLFRRGEKLIRPAQDCSIRYGYAIVLNEVLTLTRERYAERELEVILPRWRAGLDGTHTINSTESIEVVDGTLAPR